MTSPNKFFLLPLITCAVLAGCSSQPQQTGTLGDLDKPTASVAKQPAPAALRDKEAVKRAYYDYVKDADADDKLRVGAVTRIAELELALDAQQGEAPPAALEDPEYEKRVRTTISLLNDTLKKFPTAAGNDHLLYQLAKAHDQIGENDNAVAALEKMVTSYPETPYFAEAKFRIAENAFIKGHYLDAEMAYTDVIGARNQEVLREKALFKRGWARYKQELYEDAVNDYFAAVQEHAFSAYADLENADQELFDEYFRAIGLAFVYMGGEQALNEYFAQNKSHNYIFETYQTVADLQLKQQRYSDAVATYERFAKTNPFHAKVIDADLAVIRIWKNAQFASQYKDAFARFYMRYEPDSSFWKNPQARVSDANKKRAAAVIRENIILLAGYEHGNYRKSRKIEHFSGAQRWYERYLKDYSSYARQDKIYQLYAELLSQAENHEQALRYHELAAFDGNIILDKDSAYAAVFLTDTLARRAAHAPRGELLGKHLYYAELYVQLYPDDKQVASIVQNAVQMAYKANLRERVIELANALPDAAPAAIRQEVNSLKAQAYFDLQDYNDAEVAYRDLLAASSLSENAKKEVGDRLALSIYRQAEAAAKNKEMEIAAREFLRVRREAPHSDLAPVATFDAVAIFMKTEKWDEAITYLNHFQRDYPKHPLQTDVAKNLSVAYLKANRGLDAAREFERLSDHVTSDEEKMVALWQAAELYREKGDMASALRAYRDYAQTYKQPYRQNIEAMTHVANLYAKMADREKRVFWLRQIVDADNKASKSSKTERTQFLAASASFDLAELRKRDYEALRLVHPLPKSLQSKKDVMQDAVKLYGQAAVYGHAEFITRSTLAIGDIYRHFSVALLDSERPRDLNAEELEQYNILLEDQAFPFEDKAIEFYETNTRRIAQGVYDPAVKASLANLKELFPARYGRRTKVEKSIAQLSP